MIQSGVSPSSSLPFLLSSLHNKIANQIELGSLLLPHQSKQFDVQRMSNSKDLKEVRNNSIIKSQFSPQDKKTIKQLKLKIKQFQQNLQQKSKEAEEAQKKLLENERDIELRRSRQRRQQHRQQVFIRKQQKILQRKQEQLILSQINNTKPMNKKWLYKQLKREDQIRQQQQQQKRQALLSVLSQQRKGLVKISKLNEHEKSYLQRAKQNKFQRLKKIQEIKEYSRIFQNEEMKKQLRSKFYDRIATQISDKKKAEEQADKERRQSQERLKLFLERVRSQSHFMFPKKNNRTDTIESRLQSAQSTGIKKSVTNQQLHQIGNRFMKDSLKCIIKNPEKRSTSTQPNKQDKRQRPHNYLQQLKMKRLRTQSDYNNDWANCESKIEQIITSHTTKKQKIEGLKKLAYKLQGPVHTNNLDKQLQRIQAKMKILDAAMKTNND